MLSSLSEGENESVMMYMELLRWVMVWRKGAFDARRAASAAF